jgi:hypothetical protein
VGSINRKKERAKISCYCPFKVSKLISTWIRSEEVGGVSFIYFEEFGYWFEKPIH